jgi:hypothetical protein
MFHNIEIKSSDKVCTTHRTARVSGFCISHHSDDVPSHLGGDALELVDVRHYIVVLRNHTKVQKNALSLQQFHI